MQLISEYYLYSLDGWIKEQGYLNESLCCRAFRNFPIVDKDHALAGLLTIKDIVKAVSPVNRNTVNIE